MTRPVPPQRGGFTLIELLVALLLTALSLALIVSVVLTQSRAAVRMEGSVRQLEQVRLAADFLSNEVGELTRGAVLAAGKDSLTYLLPVAWGVLCGELTRADQNAAKKPKKPKKGDPPPADSDPNAALYFEPLATSIGSPTPQGFAVSLDGVEWSYYPVGDWNGLGLVAETKAYGACMDSLTTTKPAGKKGAAIPANARFLKFPNYTGVTNSQAPEQAIFAAYIQASYHFAVEDDGTRTLYRSLAGTSQRLAWPFTANAGFHYRLSDGSEVESVSGADLAQIRAIQARLPARKPNDPRFAPDSLEISPWMPLYNSR